MAMAARREGRVRTGVPWAQRLVAGIIGGVARYRAMGEERTLDEASGLKSCTTSDLWPIATGSTGAITGLPRYFLWWSVFTQRP